MLPARSVKWWGPYMTQNVAQVEKSQAAAQRIARLSDDAITALRSMPALYRVELASLARDQLACVAALTIATMPALTGSGSSGHACSTACKSAESSVSRVDLVPYLVSPLYSLSVSACAVNRCESSALGSSPSSPVSRPATPAFSFALCPAAVDWRCLRGLVPPPPRPSGHRMG